MSQLPPNLCSDGSSPEWLNKGDNTWQLSATTMVALQLMPGLIILYGGMVKKWVVNSTLMVVYTFAATLIYWVGWGYRMSFGDELVDPLGNPASALDDDVLLEQVFLGYFPTAMMVWFQFMFAVITLILIGGPLLERMNFAAWMTFVLLWHTVSYTVAAYSVWNPKGWLAKMGSLISREALLFISLLVLLALLQHIGSLISILTGVNFNLTAVRSNKRREQSAPL